jgi:hypothetical protein
MNVACFECGCKAQHEHHVVPRSKGGTKTIPLCVTCHSAVHGVDISVPALTRSALAKKKARGERVGGVPLGARVAPDGLTLETEPSEAETLELVRELRTAGASIRAIATELNARGMPARGERWHPTTVARLIRRCV